jgi:hypothetical protein
VDEELRKDPSGHYPRCDFATRDQYRHVVENIAKKSKKSELEIAKQAIQLAASSLQKDPADHHRSHVGYYLISTGRKELEKLTGFQPGFRLTLKRIIRSQPVSYYQLPIFVLTILFSILASLYAAEHTTNRLAVILTGLMYLLPASALAVLIVNWLITIFLKPQTLPKLELKDGIPEEFRTFVVLPCLLPSSDVLRELVSRLEVTYLANSEDTLDFALLSDFVDSDVEISPADESLLIKPQQRFPIE